jgi:hypothetical protein
MKFMSNPRFLAIYSGFLTAIFAVTILGGFALLGIHQHQRTKSGKPTNRRSRPQVPGSCPVVRALEPNRDKFELPNET